MSSNSYISLKLHVIHDLSLWFHNINYGGKNVVLG
jgi:hypothetical protein